MPRGGARPNSGPPPDPMALRRARKDDQASWKILPAEGRKGNAPAFPLAKWRDLDKMRPEEDRNPVLARAMDTRELKVWRELWKTPQAAAWDELSWKHDVALYVRHSVAAEHGDKSAAREARQWSNLLGLNPSAMMRNRWKVSTDELQAKRESKREETTARRSSRDRMKVIRISGER